MSLQLGNLRFQFVLKEPLFRLTLGLGLLFHHLSHPLHMHFQLLFQILQVALVLFTFATDRLVERLPFAFQLTGIRDEAFH